MPRPAPPAPALARRRDSQTTRTPRSSLHVATVPALGGAAVGPALPGGWAFGGSAPSAAELNELWLNTDLLGERDQRAPAGDDFTPLHARAAEPAPARTELTVTKLDAKGRLPLPLCPVLDAQLPAERDGGVLVVFLPGAAAAPRPGYDTAPLRVDPRRRLLLGPALRTQLGLAADATVIARADAARGVLELMAASRVEHQLDELFDAHRRAPQPAGSAAAADDRPVLTALPGGRLHPSPAGAPSAPAPELPHRGIN
ncbi:MULTISPECIES: hypothetical protein [unclassified Modestobacter]|uniref:hypothetical protein n=1 Tax=unclassified Modestobacter TaxID=2643866 RepID=UPI0022AAF595|nr:MULTISPECIES: hypothetical protein [unclassified Modestobacter]MCZ2825986.1 hypothetical protein [Modestobacter sp. VKM Ac-2981]MCZ2852949.1 hypothetical protein [Modestobacter sp. VKM Ac-2982]